MKLSICALWLAVFCGLLASHAETLSNDTPNLDYQLVGKSTDSASFTKIDQHVDQLGKISYTTNQLINLENGLHYPDPATGELIESQELVESYPGGAIAQRGYHKAIFSPNALSDVVFDALTPDQKRLAGRVLGLAFRDGTNYVTVATVQDAPGAIQPPNKVVYASAFDNVAGSIVYVWRKASLSQSVVLEESPVLPDGWNPKTARLCILTEFVALPEAKVTEQIQSDNEVDQSLIDFGVMQMLPGKAFALNGGEDTTSPSYLTAFGTDGPLIPVQKRLLTSGPTSSILEESVQWSDIQPALTDLPQAKRVELGQKNKGLIARATAIPSPKRILIKSEPIQLASAPFKSRGFAMDFDLSGSASSFTFTNSATYVISNSFSISSSATFQQNAVLKYKSNAYLEFTGSSLSFPASGTVIFSATDDDTVGTVVPNSTGNPHGSYYANPAISIYFITATGTYAVQRARMRHQKVGIRFDSNGAKATYAANYSRFEDCQTGVFENNASVSLGTNTFCSCTTNSNGSNGGSFTANGTSTDCNYYVAPPTASPAGSVNNLGSIASPWDLQYSLYAWKDSGPGLLQGDSVQMRGGTYSNLFASTTIGTSAKPTKFIGYSGEHAVIEGGDGWSVTPKIALAVSGKYTWFQNFEIKATPVSRISTFSDDDGGDLHFPDGLWLGGGTNYTQGEGTGCKAINLLVHDTKVGISCWSSAGDVEAHGCCSYYNGWDAPDRGHGHGFYIQNTNTTGKQFVNNVLFSGFANGFQAFGGTNAYIDYLDFEGNSAFNSGQLNHSSYQQNFILGIFAGSSHAAKNPKILSNYTWSTPGKGCTAVDLGYYQTGAGTTNAVMQFNFFTEKLKIQSPFSPITFSSNSIWLGVADALLGFSQTDYPTNTWYVTNAPTANSVFVRSNSYEAGRANITIYNWQLLNNVSVDVSAVLSSGQTYNVFYTGNPKGGAVLSGTYAGSNLSIPMTNLVMAALIGNNGTNPTPTNSAPSFGVFILTRASQL